TPCCVLSVLGDEGEPKRLDGRDGACQLRTRVRTIVATTWNYRQISTGTHRGLLDLWIKGANVRTQSRGSRMRLKTVELINFRGYRDLVVPIDEAMTGPPPNSGGCNRPSTEGP